MDGSRDRRQFQKSTLAVSDLHHGERIDHGDGHYLGDTGTFSNTIYNRLFVRARCDYRRFPSSRTMRYWAMSTSTSAAII